jgi:hexosaminidase
MTKTIGVLLFLSSWPLSAASLSPLYERGYVVMPEPQKVMLGTSDFRFGPEWRLEVSPGVTEGNTAVAALREDLDSRFHLKFSALRTGGGTLRLKMAVCWKDCS